MWVMFERAWVSSVGKDEGHGVQLQAWGLVMARVSFGSKLGWGLCEAAAGTLKPTWRAGGVLVDEGWGLRAVATQQQVVARVMLQVKGWDGGHARLRLDPESLPGGPAGSL